MYWAFYSTYEETKMNKPSRASLMSPRDKKAMGYDPETDTCAVARTHENCKARTGVARPGKTARDRYNKREA